MITLKDSSEPCACNHPACAKCRDQKRAMRDVTYATWNKPTEENYRTTYRSKCGRYEIEKYDSIMRGSAVWWVLKGAGPETQRKTLRAAKRVAELHSKVHAR